MTAAGTPGEPASTWAPADLPGLRRELVAHLGTLNALAWNEMFAAAGKGVVLPGRTPLDSARAAVANERRRLTEADLYYVAPEMVDLVLAAYRSMPEFAPQRSDLPSEYGLIVFGKPLATRPLVPSEIALYEELSTTYTNVPDPRGEATALVAAAWGPYDGGPHRRGAWARYGGGLFINFYTDRDQAMRATMAADPALVRQTFPPLINENEASFALWPGPGRPMPPGLTEDDYVIRDQELNDFSGEGGPGFVGPWTRMLMAAFTLMRQPGLAEQRTERPPRHERRRDAREGIPEKDVRIVHLRRLSQPPADGAGAAATAAQEREWRHQWIVRGHWRNQAYGKDRALRRPKWIAPYTKGPEDRPLIGGEKVNVWDR